MAARLPLHALLSGALVALTIDIDNAVEHVMPHTTTALQRSGTPAAGPWLTSLVMWANCLRWIDDAGTPRAELERRARTTMLALSGMQRWGYLRITPASLVVPTARGLRARAVWAKVVAAKDGRLAERYGADAICALRAACAAVGAADGSGPDYLPVIGYGLATPSDTIVPGAAPSSTIANVPLVFALARVLLARTIAFERDAPVSLPVYANVLRVLEDGALTPREIALRAGVSAEGVAMALTLLQTRGYTRKERAIGLTDDGHAALARCHHCVATLETQFAANHGSALRSALEALVGDLGPGSPLVRGIITYPDNWRAAVPSPATMPHAPMVLHRGGFPDGA